MALLALAAAASPVPAQANAPGRFPERTPAATAASTSAIPPALATPAGAFVSSLILPGSGQAALGLRRWVLYGLAEAGLWYVHLEANGDVRRLTRAYKDLAWDVARDRNPEPRRDGGWGYYEAMSRYDASGAFDADPAEPGTQPEEDPSTYNGSVWELARGLYLPGGVADPASPLYQSAIGYYEQRAAGPQFLWSWAGSEPELDRFRRLIDAADDESRTATTALGLVLANHLVAAIDALVVARLRGDSGATLDSEILRTGAQPELRLSLRVPLDI